MEKQKTIQDLINKAKDLDHVKVEFENPINMTLMAEAVINYVEDLERSV